MRGIHSLVKTIVRKSQEGALGSFGKRLAHAMRESGVSGRDLAEQLDVDQSSVSLWRNDKREPTPANFEAAASMLGVSEAWLRYGVGHMEPTASGAGHHRTVSASIEHTIAHTVARESGLASDASAVGAAIASGQRDLGRWLAEYSARLLEAAAADARQHATQLFAPAEEHAHEGNDAQVDTLHRAISAATDASAAAADETAPRRRRRSEG